jgi:hypothetical protein
MVFLVLAFALGVAMRLDPDLRFLWPTYLHVLVVGWLTQLIFGVAFWLFPRASRERMRGHEGLIWLSFSALNAGLLLRIVGEPFDLGAADGPVLLVSAACHLVAALSFIANVWPRLKAR